MGEVYGLTEQQHREVGKVVRRFRTREPIPRKQQRNRGRTVHEGIVKAWTAASWNSGTNTMTAGTIEIYPFASDYTIDRSGDTVDLEHPYTHTVPAGANVSWIGSKLVAGTCDAVTGWS